jgi:hypothetical protein
VASAELSFLVHGPPGRGRGGVALRIGYARVSTSDQNLNLQKDALREVGCERLFTDIAGNANLDLVASVTDITDKAQPALIHERIGF